MKAHFRGDQDGSVRSGYVWLPAALIVVLIIFLGCDARKHHPRDYHIAVLSHYPDLDNIVNGFKDQMSILGYVEGGNVTYERLDLNVLMTIGENAESKLQILGRPDLVFSLSTETSLVAKGAVQGTNIPLIFVYAGIEGADLVSSIREPGGQITGVRYPGPEQISKRLEILNQIAPRNDRILVIFNRVYPTRGPALERLRTLAKLLAVTLVEEPVDDLDQMRMALQARDQQSDTGVDAILLMPDNFNHSPSGWQMLRAFAARHELPIAGSFRYTVEQGAIFGNANDLFEVGRLAAPLAHKIFQGIPAGTIPVVTPEQELCINYRRIQELGLQVPEGLLRQAKEILR